MPSWLPSIPYPAPDQHGFWEPVTSTLQWCEEDYYLTIYSAEIMNTLTNLMFWYCAWEGIKSCRRNGHDTVFQVAYYGYFLVGFGSFMFHSTLKYPWQLVDELNMIYTTCLMGFASLSYGRSFGFGVFIGFGCIAFCAGITAYYHYVQDPVFHQTVYAIMTIWLVFRSAWQMETKLRPRWRGTSGRLTKADRRDLDILYNMWILVVWGVSVFLAGFALWGMDNERCSTLRQWRRELGMPWGFLLEGHAWWHLFTGYGAYCYIVWGIYLRHVLNERQDEYQLVWPRLWRFPEVVRISPSKGDAKEDANGGSSNKKSMNGHAKSA